MATVIEFPGRQKILQYKEALALALQDEDFLIKRYLILEAKVVREISDLKSENQKTEMEIQFKGIPDTIEALFKFAETKGLLGGYTLDDLNREYAQKYAEAYNIKIK